MQTSFIRCMLILVVVFAMVYIISFSYLQLKVPKIIRKKEHFKRQKCQIQELDPYHADVLPYLSGRRPPPCTMKRYGTLRDGILYLKVKYLQKAWLYYIRRRGDFDYKLSRAYRIHNKKHKDVEIKYRVKEDFFKLRLTINNKSHEEYHGAFPESSKRTESPTSSPKQNQSKSSDDDQPDNGNTSVNILMVMLDAVSNANFRRSLKKSYAYLEEDPNSYIFKGQSVVGDGTTAQLTAAFTGIPIDEQPEARTGVNGAENVDRWPFIFNDMHKLGYKTLYSEDSSSGTFNYRLIGWKDIPTTKYTRPWWMAMEHILKKNSPVCGLEFSFEYLKRFFKTYNNYKKFAFVLLSRVSHDDMNYLPSLDQDILDIHTYLKDNGYIKNTVVFTFGDHGYRVGSFRSTLHGRLEERLPFLAITLPPSFQLYVKDMKNMEDNTNLLTSPFDMYATLQHLLSWPHFNNRTKRKYGETLFSDITRLNRTCADAGVPDHYCACLEFDQVDLTYDTTVIKIATNVISYINNLNEKVAKGKCRTLTLRRIIRAGRRVRKFYKDSQIMRYIYEIAFSVTPSGGEYEVTRECTLRKDGSVDIIENNLISRINLYRSQPDCVAKQHPNLRKFCYCKNYEGEPEIIKNS